MKAIIYIIAAMVVICLGMDWLATDTTTRICNEAQAIHQISKCHEIERSLGTEYLCNQDHCWAEIKE